jgi:hypothetical protein
MWETRRRRESLAAVIRSETVPTKPHAIQPYSFGKAAIAEVVRAERQGRANAEGIKIKL